MNNSYIALALVVILSIFLVANVPDIMEKVTDDCADDAESYSEWADCMKTYRNVYLALGILSGLVVICVFFFFYRALFSGHNKFSWSLGNSALLATGLGFCAMALISANYLTCFTDVETMSDITDCIDDEQEDFIKNRAILVAVVAIVSFIALAILSNCTSSSDNANEDPPAHSFTMTLASIGLLIFLCAHVWTVYDYDKCERDIDTTQSDADQESDKEACIDVQIGLVSANAVLFLAAPSVIAAIVGLCTGLLGAVLGRRGFGAGLYVCMFFWNNMVLFAYMATAVDDLRCEKDNLGDASSTCDDDSTDTRYDIAISALVVGGALVVLQGVLSWMCGPNQSNNQSNGQQMQMSSSNNFY